MAKQEREWASVRELAEKWAVSDRTVWRLLWDNQLPYYRIRNSVRIRLADAEAFLAGTLVKPTADKSGITAPDAAATTANGERRVPNREPGPKG